MCLFAESSAVAAAISNADSLVLSESELALVAMDRGRWAEAAERVEQALAVVDKHRMHDYATSVLAFAAAARVAAHRGDLQEVDRQITRAMRARPTCTFVLPFLAVGTRLQLAKVHLSKGDHSTAGHLLREIDDILLHRPDLGALVDQVSELRELLTSSMKGGAAGGPPLTPAELRLLPYLQTHLRISEIGERLFVSRNTISSELSSIYRKLGVSSRGDAVRQAEAIGLRGGEPRSCTGLMFQSIVGVVAEGKRQVRGGRDDLREPNDGNDADEHVDDLGRGCARADRGIGLCAVRRDGTSGRDQRGEAGECQGLRIEPTGHDFGSDFVYVVFNEPRIANRKTAQPLRVIQSQLILSRHWRQTRSTGRRPAGGRPAAPLSVEPVLYLLSDRAAIIHITQIK